MKFEIVSVSFCPNGHAPQWTWWIRGIAGTLRYGVLGTDDEGSGLYEYEYRGDQSPQRKLLLDDSHFSIPANISKEDATHLLKLALVALGWPITLERTE